MSISSLCTFHITIRKALARHWNVFFLSLGLSVMGGLAPSVQAAADTWTGNTTANLNAVDGFNVLPTSGDSFTFSTAGSAGTALNNDLAAGFTVAGITFSSTASAYTFSGNAFTLTTGITLGSANTQTFSTAIATSGAIALTLNNGGTSGLIFNGGLSGAGAITQSGTAAGVSTVTLGGDNSGFTGSYNETSSASDRLIFSAATAGSSAAAWTFDRAVSGGTALNFAAGTISFGSLSGGGYVRNNIVGTDIISVGALNTSTTFSGQILTTTGNIALTKTGTGTLTLSGTNAYTGTTTISAGTLQIGAGSTTGSLASTSAIVDNSILAFNRTTAVVQGTDFSTAAITGSGSITHAGTGALTLSAANTYSGGTTVTGGGTLQLGNSSTGTAGTVGSNGSLTSGPLGTGSLIISTAAGTLDLNGQTLGNRFSNSTNNTTIGNTSATTANVTGAMDGSLTSNVISDFQFGGNNGDINWTGQISRTSGTVGFTKIGSDTVTFSGTTANVGTSSSSDPVKLNLGTLGLGMTGTTSGAFASYLLVQGGTLKFRPDLGTVSGGNTFGGQINTEIQMTSGAVDLFGSSGQNSRLQQFYGTGGTLTNTSATAGVLGIAARNSTAYTYGGTVQDGTGTVGIDFTSTGTTGTGRINLFTGTNTYSGPTSISYGTFELGNALAAQNSTITVNAASGLGTNSTYSLTTTNPLAFANGIGTFTIGGLSGAGNIALTDIGRTAAGATATAASVTLQIGSSLATNAAPAAYTGVISDGTVAGAQIVKIGTSSEALNGTNSYTGGTTVKNGTLTTTNVAGFGTGALTIGDTSGTNSAAVSANVSGTITNAITVAAGSSGTRTLASVNGGGTTATFSGAVTLNSDLMLAQNFTTASSGTLALTGQITGSGNILVTNTSGVANSVRLSGNNASTFTGNVSITNGETLFTSSTALGTSNTVTLDSISQLNSNGQSLTVAGLNSTGTGGSVVISNSTGQTLALGGSGTYNYAGVISNAGNVAKTGSGTQTLSGVNTYTGATTIGAPAAGNTAILSATANGGTLGAAANNALGSTTAITVNNGGTLLLTGATTTGSTPGGISDRVNNAATISLGTTGGTGVGGTIAISGTGPLLEGTARSTTNNGSTTSVSPYATASTTSIAGLGALTLTSNSTLDFGASTTGTLVFTSFTDASNAFKLNIINYTNTTANGTTTSGIDGTDDRLVFNANLSAFIAAGDFTFNGSAAGVSQVQLDSGFFELTVTPVPEPATWFGGMLMLGILGYSQRRRFLKQAGLPVA